MFRVLSKDLILGDIIIWDSVTGTVLSMKSFGKSIEINVRLLDGELRSWLLDKSETLELISPEESALANETTVLDSPVQPIVPAFKNPKPITDVKEADTHPVGRKPTIQPASKPVKP